jgi:glutamate--cysteine ligase
LRGREPQLQLQRGDQSLTLTQWGSELVDALSPIADALDAARGGSRHRDAVVAARAALAEPSAAPSARVLQAMARDHRNSYAEFALAWSVRHRDALRALALDPQVERRFEELAADSISAQRQIEAADGMTFEAYRHKYLSQDLMSGDQLQPQADAAR